MSCILSGITWICPQISHQDPAKGKHKCASGLFISQLVLVVGYFLRKTMVEAGRTSSKDACDPVECQARN